MPFTTSPYAAEIAELLNFGPVPGGEESRSRWDRAAPFRLPGLGSHEASLPGLRLLCSLNSRALLRSLRSAPEVPRPSRSRSRSLPGCAPLQEQNHWKMGSHEDSSPQNAPAAPSGFPAAPAMALGCARGAHPCPAGSHQCFSPGLRSISGDATCRRVRSPLSDLWFSCGFGCITVLPLRAARRLFGRQVVEIKPIPLGQVIPYLACCYRSRTLQAPSVPTKPAPPVWLFQEASGTVND